MYVNLDYELEKQLKIAVATRSPRFTIKKAIIEAINLWIAQQNST